jgi:hypothetical protein
MAKRRMFSKDIIDTDAFLELQASTQALYFHLGLHADDDGFVSSPKKIMRSIEADAADMDTLVSNNFIIRFDTGVCAIRHWRIHNYIQKDRYTPTIHLKEKSTLDIDDNGFYECMDTTCIQFGSTGKVSRV